MIYRIVSVIFLAMIFTTCKADGKVKQSNDDAISIINDGVDVFHLNTPMSSYDFSKYVSVTDTSALLSEDETSPTIGKNVHYSNGGRLTLWQVSDTIFRIEICSKVFRTKTGASVGMRFSDLFKMIKDRQYQFDYESDLSFCIPDENIDFEITLPDIVNLSDEEINDLYKGKLSISTKKLKQLFVSKIIISRFLDSGNLKISDDF